MLADSLSRAISRGGKFNLGSRSLRHIVQIIRRVRVRLHLCLSVCRTFCMECVSVRNSAKSRDRWRLLAVATLTRAEEDRRSWSVDQRECSVVPESPSTLVGISSTSVTRLPGVLRYDPAFPGGTTVHRKPRGRRKEHDDNSPQNGKLSRGSEGCGRRSEQGEVFFENGRQSSSRTSAGSGLC